MTLAPAVEQALRKLRPSIQTGSSYEAQQKVKTIYSRFRSRRQLDLAYQLLSEASSLQFSQKEVSCGTELAVMLLQAFVSDSVPADAAHVLQVHKVLDAFPAASTAGPTAGSQYDQVCMAALKWARKGGAGVADRQALHDKAASYFWEANGTADLQRASMHFARGTQSSTFAQAVRQAAQEGEMDEEDLFVVRAALQIVAVRGLGSLRDRAVFARTFRDAYFSGILPLQTPLMHFVDFFLQALDKESLPLVRMLRSQYVRCLGRDEYLGALLDAIETTHFQVDQGVAGVNGLLGSVLRMLASNDG